MPVPVPAVVPVPVGDVPISVVDGKLPLVGDVPMSVVDGKLPPVGAVPPPVAGGATGKFARSVAPVLVAGNPPVVPVFMGDGVEEVSLFGTLSVGKLAIISIGDTSLEVVSP